MKIEKIPVSKLKLFEKNPRTISEEDLENLKRSIEKFGMVDPLIIDEKNEIIGGHQRLKAAKALGIKTVPCVRVSGLSPGEKKALNLALNRISGEFVEPDLIKLLEEIKQDEEGLLEYTGFNDEEISQLLDKMLQGEEDDVAALSQPAEPKYKIKQGELFQLGNHRLLCGDSTTPADVGRLLGGGARMALVVTDPPYGVAYKQSNYERGGVEWEEIKGDELKGEDLKEFQKKWISTLVPYAASNYSLYIFFGDRTRHNLMNALDELKIHYALPIVWVKNNSTITWDRYHPQHETIVYAGPGSTPTGKNSRWFGPTTETTVWEENIVVSGTAIHPTQKPVPLLVRAIKNSTKRGENIYDPFGGSGSTLVACEETERNCYMMEIEPYYCSVIIERWEKLTGKKAERVK